MSTQLRKDLEAALIRHDEIEDDEIGLYRSNLLQTVISVNREMHFVATLPELRFVYLAKKTVVIDKKYLSFTHGCWRIMRGDSIQRLVRYPRRRQRRRPAENASMTEATR